MIELQQRLLTKIERWQLFIWYTGRRDARVVEAIISRNPECYELVDNWWWNFLHYVGFRFEVEELRNLVDNMLASSLMDEGGCQEEHYCPFFCCCPLKRNLWRFIWKSKGNYEAINKQNVSVAKCWTIFILSSRQLLLLLFVFDRFWG